MRILIVGAVAAGTTAGTKIRRNDPAAEVVIYERDSTISYSGCGLPYFVGGEVARLDALTPRGPSWFAERYGIEVLTRHEVTAVDAANRLLTVTDLATGTELVDGYDTLVLATGARSTLPEQLPGIRSRGVFGVRTPADARAIQDHVRTAGVTDAVVLGAGFIGLEMTEQLTRRGIRTTLVEQAEHVMPPLDADIAEIVAGTLRKHGVATHCAESATALVGDPVRSVRLSSGELLDAQLVVVAVGIEPNTDLARQAGVALGESGAVAVDARMATNVPGIYAVGDVAESFDLVTGRPLWRPLGTTANKMGRIAGDAITGGGLTHRGILGTGIFRLFDLTVAQTGWTESAAQEAGLDVVVHRTTKTAHAEYLDGPDITIKAIADRGTGRVLGAQVVGPEGVDKRVDVLATAITFGARAEDLFHLDLAYSPPYSTAKDPVLYVGMGLTRALRGED